MKKRKNLILYIVALLMLFPSCNDWLSLEPDDEVILGRFWNSKEDVHSALMGCYASMMNIDAMRRYFLWGELRADMVKTTAKASNDEVLLKNGEISIDNQWANWSSIYATINNCNTLLHYAADTQKKDASFSEALLHQYESEAKAIRALMYFYLVRTFGDVPYVLNASLTDQQDYAVPKSSGDAILDDLAISLQEIADKNYLASKYDTSRATKGRFTLSGLKVLLADIYLWREKYSECELLCKDVLNDPLLTLVKTSRGQRIISEGAVPEDNVYSYILNESSVNNLFLSMFVNGNSVESIFELQFDEDYNNPFVRMFNPSYATLYANVDLIQGELFIPSDLDKDWYDMRGEGFGYKQGVIWKWVGLDRSEYTMRVDKESFSNWIFYRLAEVYLMRAEALVQIGIKNGEDQEKFQEAVSLINEVRKRANATETTDMAPDINAMLEGKILEEYILIERQRELSHEGKRWFDVLRQARRDNYGGSNINYLITLALSAADPDKVTSLQSKWRSNRYSHYLPIYVKDMESNPALEQNPFYAQ